MMPIYCTEYLALNEIGRPCKMAGQIEADSEVEARVKCEELGHTYCGVLVDEIDAPEMGGVCDKVMKQRDEDWLKGI